MNAEELTAALTKRGLTATTEVAADGVEKVWIRRPEDGSTTNEIGIENGIPFWPWGNPIRPATDEESEDDPHAIAAQLVRFLCERTHFRVSS